MSKAFIATITNGRIALGSEHNIARFNDWAKLNEGKAVRIERDVPIRSLSQNAFYWAWLGKVEQETGNASEDMHIYFRSIFLPKRIVKIKGKKEHQLETLGSTTKLSKVEFGEYMEKCARHTGIPLPTPEEIAEMGYISNSKPMK